MRDLYTSGALKKAANLSINSDLLQQPKTLKINLSATLEHEPARLIRQRGRAHWLKDNRPGTSIPVRDRSCCSGHGHRAGG